MSTNYGRPMSTARLAQAAEQERLRQQRQMEMIAKGQVQVPGQVQTITIPSPSVPPVAQQASQQPFGLFTTKSSDPSDPSQLSLEDLQKELYRRKDELNKKVETMVLDANAYRVNIPSIRLLTEDKTPSERIKYSGNIAVATGVPIIIVLVYIGEIYGSSQELHSQIASLMKFYSVDEVLNVKVEGSNK